MKGDSVGQQGTARKSTCFGCMSPSEHHSIIWKESHYQGRMVSSANNIKYRHPPQDHDIGGDNCRSVSVCSLTCTHMLCSLGALAAGIRKQRRTTASVRSTVSQSHIGHESEASNDSLGCSASPNGRDAIACVTTCNEAE